MRKQATICAIASSVGRGGVGIVRISGALTKDIAKKMLGRNLKPRYAHYGSFFNKDGSKIDKGIAIFYPAPNSFTGEDVLELQGHGGIMIMHLILESVLSLGAVAAEAGEFSKRAFLNGKMDLVQAEAVADIIDASSAQAANSALRSLSGEFSNKVKKITEAIADIRVFIEASIDFTDEEIDFLQSSKVREKILDIKQKISNILLSAKQGAILKEGLTIAIAGKPNAGKSSLLNALTQTPSAIVTDIAGTTRDVLKETINIDGMPLNIIDTAGLHIGKDEIEKEGIKRAHLEINRADVILLVFDAKDKKPDLSILQNNVKNKPLLLIKNKIDLTGKTFGKTKAGGYVQLAISAKFDEGLDILKQELTDIAGLKNTGEDVILARKRHIIALELTLKSINNALKQTEYGASELVAEDLRQAGQYMASITGEFSADDLLGKIFSSFCIGK